MRRWLLVALTMALAAVTPLGSQTQSTLGTSRTTTPEDEAGSDTAVYGGFTDPFGSQGASSRISDYQRPVIISGKVVMEDGTPPSEPVKIERICGGQAVPEGFTDSKGRFNIQLGADPSALMTDASVPTSPDGNIGGGFIQDPFGGVGTTAGGLGRVNPLGCDLRADLAGYTAEPIRLGRRAVFENPNVGTIVLRRRAGVEGSAISMTTLEAPKKAKKAFEKAFKAVNKKKPDPQKAIEHLERALAEYPTYAAAWHLLGQLRYAQGAADDARHAFEKAIEADENYLSPYDPLMRMALHGRRWDEAADLSGRVLALNPLDTAARYCHAVASYRLGRSKEAEKSALAVRAAADGERFPEMHHLLGDIYAKRGEFKAAAAELQSYLTARPDSAVADELRRKLSEWEALGVIEAAASDQAQRLP